MLGTGPSQAGCSVKMLQCQTWITKVLHALQGIWARLSSYSNSMPNHSLNPNLDCVSFTTLLVDIQVTRGTCWEKGCRGPVKILAKPRSLRLDTIKRDHKSLIVSPMAHGEQLLEEQWQVALTARTIDSCSPGSAHPLQGTWGTGGWRGLEKGRLEG